MIEKKVYKCLQIFTGLFSDNDDPIHGLSHLSILLDKQGWGEGESIKINIALRILDKLDMSAWKKWRIDKTINISIFIRNKSSRSILK